MANKRIVFEVVAEGKNLKIVQHEVEGIRESIEKTTAARDKAAASQHDYNKREKGIYQGNLASAKSFSKIQQSLGSGSSGLVGAYATLAANVFAASAAFLALQKAAQLQQMEASLTFIGNAGGKNLDILVNKLQEVTGNAISMEQALRSASLGVSAGFSSKQLTDLAKVARGASLALGRDMSDAMDRLTRGAAKLEPEILDELGIIVRLDTATASYAATVGKATNELTQYERTQAFVNAINEQGAEKFGAIADAIQPNVYDQLSAALANLAKYALTGVSDFLKWSGILEGLTTNSLALTGAVVLFASTISRQLLPVLYAMPKAAAKAAQSLVMTSTEKLQEQFSAFGKMPDGMKDLPKKVKEGSLSIKELDEGIKASSRSLKAYEGVFTRYKNALDLGNMSQEKYNASLAASKAKELEQIAIHKSLIEYKDRLTQATIRNNIANSLELVSGGKVVDGFKVFGGAIKDNWERMGKLERTAKTLGPAFNVVAQGAFIASGGIRLLGSALLTFLPYIGLILTFGPMVYDFVVGLFPGSELRKVKERVQSTLSEISEEFAKFAEYNQQFEITFAKSFDADRIIGAYKVLAGVSSTIAVQTQKAIDVAGTESVKQLIDTQKEISNLQAKIEAITNLDIKTNQISTIGDKEARKREIASIKQEIGSLTEEEAKLQVKFEDLQLTAAKSAVTEALINLNLMTGIAEATKSTEAFKNRLEAIRKSAKTPVEVILDLRKAEADYNRLSSSIEGIPAALGAIQKAQNNLLQRSTTPMDEVINGYQELSSLLNNVATLAIGGEADLTIKKYAAEIQEVTELLGTTDMASINKAVRDYLDALRQARDLTLAINIATKAHEDTIKSLTAITGSFVELKQIEINLNRESYILQQEALKQQLAVTRDDAQRLRLTVELSKLQQQIIDPKEQEALLAKDTLRYREQEIQIQKSLNDASIQRLKNEQTIRGLTSLYSNDLLDSLAIIEAQFAARKQQEGAEANIAQEKLGNEYTIAQYRLDALKTQVQAELNAYNEITAAKLLNDAKIHAARINLQNIEAQLMRANNARVAADMEGLTIDQNIRYNVDMTSVEAAVKTPLTQQVNMESVFSAPDTKALDAAIQNVKEQTVKVPVKADVNVGSLDTQVQEAIANSMPSEVILDNVNVSAPVKVDFDFSIPTLDFEDVAANTILSLEKPRTLESSITVSPNVTIESIDIVKLLSDLIPTSYKDSITITLIPVLEDTIGSVKSLIDNKLAGLSNIVQEFETSYKLTPIITITPIIEISPIKENPIVGILNSLQTTDSVSPVIEVTPKIITGVITYNLDTVLNELNQPKEAHPIVTVLPDILLQTPKNIDSIVTSVIKKIPTYQEVTSNIVIIPSITVAKGNKPEEILTPLLNTLSTEVSVPSSILVTPNITIDGQINNPIAVVIDELNNDIHINTNVKVTPIITISNTDYEKPIKALLANIPTASELNYTLTIVPQLNVTPVTGLDNLYNIQGLTKELDYIIQLTPIVKISEVPEYSTSILKQFSGSLEVDKEIIVTPTIKVLDIPNFDVSEIINKVEKVEEEDLLVIINPIVKLGKVNLKALDTFMGEFVDIKELYTTINITPTIEMNRIINSDALDVIVNKYQQPRDITTTLTIFPNIEVVETQSIEAKLESYIKSNSKKIDLNKEVDITLLVSIKNLEEAKKVIEDILVELSKPREVKVPVNVATNTTIDRAEADTKLGAALLFRPQEATAPVKLETAVASTNLAPVTEAVENVATTISKNPVTGVLEASLEVSRESMDSVTFAKGVIEEAAASPIEALMPVSVVPIIDTPTIAATVEQQIAKAVPEKVEKKLDVVIISNTTTESLNLEELNQFKDQTQSTLGVLQQNGLEAFGDLGKVTESLAKDLEVLKNAYDELLKSQKKQASLNEGQADAAEQNTQAQYAAAILGLAKGKAEERYVAALQDGAKISSDVVKTQLDYQNRKTIEAKDELSAQVASLTAQLANTTSLKEQVNLSEELAAKTALLSSIRTTIVSQQEIEAKQALVLLDIQEKVLKIEEARIATGIEAYKNQKALENLGKGRGAELDVQQQLEVAQMEYDLKVKSIDNETALTIARLKAEETISKSRLEIIAQEWELLSKNIAATDPKGAKEALNSANEIRSLVKETSMAMGAQAQIVRDNAEQQKDAAKEQLKNAKISIIDQNLPKLPQLESAGIVFPPIDLTSVENGIAAAMELFKQTKETLAKEQGELNGLSLAGFTNGIQSAAGVASAAMAPLINQLSQLGPDGVYVASLAQGSILVADSIGNITEAFESLSVSAFKSGEGFKSMASIMEGVSSIAGALGQIQSASSEQKVSAIENEIAAEQKRDGKSKESLAKIAALEKKKDAEKRKAFEENKKILMAQTVMSTAAGIMSVWADPTLPIWGKWGMTALVAALGATQLSTISGMSYQGGAGSISATGPSSVSFGDRNNKVDVNQKATAGELDYIQGARGTGTGANDFRAAFVGARYRANGGYVVGEQGPELFMPDRPGRIVPNDRADMPNKNINVSFNVSAIDANSFNDMLADQRGNIIQLIREAANAHGETFLEDVDTLSIAPQNSKYTAKRI